MMQSAEVILSLILTDSKYSKDTVSTDSKLLSRVKMEKFVEANKQDGYGNIGSFTMGNGITTKIRRNRLRTI